MLPGLVELHLLGTPEAPFLHLHPYPHHLQHCFSFYKILEKHRLNTSVPIKRGYLGWWGPEIPDSPNMLALGTTLYFFWAAPSINPIPCIWQEHCCVLEGKAHPSLGHWPVLWGQEHKPCSGPGWEGGHWGCP